MFRLTSALSLILPFILSSSSYPTSYAGLERRAISPDVLDQLTRFVGFSSAAYLPGCSSPNGTTSVTTFSGNATGYIARDDENQQIIVAFRGSFSVQDWLTDVQIALVPFESEGVTDTNSSQAHSGFLTAYNSVASDILSSVSSELSAHPNYTLIATGHSLGGALASIAAISLAANFPDASLKVFTYGQPRTGDSAYAGLTESLVGAENIFRGVHTTDLIPNVIPESLGYEHHETQFWQFQDPSTSDNVKQCSGREDADCSDGVTALSITAHLTYFGITMGTNFLSC